MILSALRIVPAGAKTPPMASEFHPSRRKSIWECGAAGRRLRPVQVLPASAPDRVLCARSAALPALVDIRSETGNAMSYQWDKERPPATDLTQHVKSRSTWVRLLFMLLFAVIFYIAEMVLFAVAAIQFLFKLFSGAPNARLTGFGASLALFLAEVAAFLTYNTEDMPFPFADWPYPEPRD